MSSHSTDLDVYHLVVAAGTNATLIKANPSAPIRNGVRLYSWFVYNASSSPRKLNFHDTGSAPTAGANVKFAIILPGNTAANVGFPDGILFNDGMAITTTTGILDNDSAGVTASDLVINLFYK